MAEKFDPYYKWLGIPPKDQPPSHYRLLGLDVFESDPEVIDRAANRLMDYLHSISDGQHVAHAQALLNEIAAARLCLLDEEEKALYDERLRAQEAAKRPERADIFDDPEEDSSERSSSGERSARTVRGTRSRRTAPPAAPPALALPPVAPPVQGQNGTPERRPRGKKKSSAILAIGLVVGVAVVGGLAVYLVLLMQGDPQKTGAPLKSDAQATARGQKESKVADSSLPAFNGAKTEAAKTAEVTKTDDTPPFTFDPSKTSNPAAVPAGKDRPRPKPRPETAKLLEDARAAIKQKDVKSAMDLLRNYISDPGAPEVEMAEKWLLFLHDISTEGAIQLLINEWSDAELRDVERGKLRPRNLVSEELDEVYRDAVLRNIPEAKRRRAMAADAKSKANAPPAPDPLTKPVEFLTSQGLTKRGAQWQLNEDAAIAAMSGVAESDLEKPYTTILKRTADRLKPINKLRAQLKEHQQKADEARSANKKPPPRTMQFINEYESKLDSAALGANQNFSEWLLDRVKPRNDLLLAVLKAAKEVDPVDEKYRALTADPRVAQAESKLAGEKVGPSAEFRQNHSKYVKTAELVLNDETPLFLRGKETVLSVLVNDIPVDIGYVREGQTFNAITGELAKKLGIAIPANAEKGKLKITGKDAKPREVTVQSVTIPSIRLGNHMLKDVEFVVTGPDAPEITTSLEPKAFTGFRVAPDYENFVFKIRPQDAPEPKPAKEMPPAKVDPAKAGPAKAAPAKAAVPEKAAKVTPEKGAAGNAAARKAMP